MLNHKVACLFLFLLSFFSGAAKVDRSSAVTSGGREGGSSKVKRRPSGCSPRPRQVAPAPASQPIGRLGSDGCRTEGAVVYRHVLSFSLPPSLPSGMWGVGGGLKRRWVSAQQAVLRGCAFPCVSFFSPTLFCTRCRAA